MKNSEDKKQKNMSERQPKEQGEGPQSEHNPEEETPKALPEAEQPKDDSAGVKPVGESAESAEREEADASAEDNSGAQNVQNMSRRELRKQLKLSDITHFDNHSFLALLVRSFLSFMLITVAATLLIVLIANWASKNSRINVSVQSVADYEIELSNNPTGPSIPLEAILGADGWLDIVDAESGKLLYSSVSDSEHSYTTDELVCIQNHGSGVTVRSVKFNTADGSFNYFISKYYSNGSDNPDEYLLLSADLKLISGTMSEFEGKEAFTPREFEFLVFNPMHEGEEIVKYGFTSRDGTPCYAVYLDTNNDEVTPPWLFVIITIIGLVGLLVTALGFYIRYINKHVQRPINALGNAMAVFAKNGYREKLNYIGSKDFEQLVATFNDMVGLLNASEEQRLALEKDRQRMLAGLSHDLKTPMTVIEGYAKAIRDGVVSEKDKPKYLNLIISKSEYMSELINEFYEFSKLDHPDFKLNREPTDVVEFVRSFLASKYDEFEINGYELQADLSHSRVFVSLDHEQFTRVLDNLVSNFFKYTPKGSTLAVEEVLQGDSVAIYIKDNGGGIPASARADIFAPFVVAEASRSKQGTGLGLTVCKKIVEQHGGEIKLLEPTEQFGTVFEITLPVLQTQDDQN